MLTLRSSPASPFVRKVRIAASVLGVERDIAIEPADTMNPSDTVRRQMYVNFWFETEGIKLRHHIGIDNIMWESDFPHVASFYPRSWESIEHVLDGVPPQDRRKLLYENAVRVYGIAATVSGKIN